MYGMLQHSCTALTAFVISMIVQKLQLQEAIPVTDGNSLSMAAKGNKHMAEPEGRVIVPYSRDSRSKIIGICSLVQFLVKLRIICT